jgi:hypothetical protein
MTQARIYYGIIIIILEIDWGRHSANAIEEKLEWLATSDRWWLAWLFAGDHLLS